MHQVSSGYDGTSEIEHGLCASAVDNPLAKARGLSLRTGAQTMFYLSVFINGISTLSWKTTMSFLFLPAFLHGIKP